MLKMNALLQFLSLIFGLLPFNRTKETSLFFDYAIMIIVPVAYSICYYLTLFRENYGVYQLLECNSICRLGNTLFMHLGCFLYLTTCLLSLRRRKRFFICYEKCLDDIDRAIARCRKLTTVRKPKSKRAEAIFYSTWIFVCVIFGYALYYDGWETFWRMKERFIVSIMTTAFPFLAGSIVQGQFIYYVSKIMDRFNSINDLFDAIKHKSDRKSNPVSIFDIESRSKKNIKVVDDLRVIDLQDEKKNLSLSDDDEDSDVENEPTKEERVADQARNGNTSESNLPELFRLHDKILTLSVITNDEFGAQCVPYMTVCFVIGIFGIFLETKVIFIVGGMSPLLDYTARIYVIWSLLMMVVAYIVLRLCCNANSKSKNSAMIVHEIMQKKPTFMLGNDLYYNKMKAFTLQFLHWEGYFHFNGIGLFALDYTFIFSTVSAATSYLIVLLQFDMTAILKAEGLL